MLFKGYPLVRTTIRQFTHTARSLAQTGAISSPARAVLYVPGSDVKKLAKIFASPADCVVMDCEDGVALSRKDEARNNIRALFDTDERVQNDTDGKFAVRINPAHTEFAVQDIAKLFNFKKEALATKKPTQLLPKCVFVPKTNHPDDIRWLYEKLETKLNGLDHALNLYFYMESAMSLINLNEIIKSALAASTDRYNDRYKLEGFVFGSDDFCADISATRTKEADELAYARQKLVTHCKAYKLKVIDMVYIDFKDLDGLRVQSEQGFRMGFTGKQVIHPMQVDVTQEAFTPSKEKIKWACGLVEAFEAHQSSGAGAFTYQGQMIDMPSLLQAKNILAIAQKVNKSSAKL